MNQPKKPRWLPGVAELRAKASRMAKSEPKSDLKQQIDGFVRDVTSRDKSLVKSEVRERLTAIAEAYALERTIEELTTILNGFGPVYSHKQIRARIAELTAELNGEKK